MSTQFPDPLVAFQALADSPGRKVTLPTGQLFEHAKTFMGLSSCFSRLFADAGIWPRPATNWVLLPDPGQ
jgi:hypothetical protein